MNVGDIPMVNGFTSDAHAAVNSTRFPADWLICSNCDLVQLGFLLDQQTAFPPNYSYTSGSTQLKLDNFRDLFNESQSLVNLTPQSLIVDLGANDGSLLKLYSNAGYIALGVEPTDVADKAKGAGIIMLKERFNAKCARKIANIHGHAEIVCANNLIAHVEQFGEILNGVRILLKPNGIFIVEVQYLFDLIDNLGVDSIYHEHNRYYSLTTLEKQLSRYGFELFRAKHIQTHGGSIRLYLSYPGVQPLHPSVNKFRELEKARGSVIDQLSQFVKKIETARHELISLIHQIRGTSAKIFGIGAAPRTAALINFLGIDNSMIDCVLEVPNSLKIGCYVPGTRIPVLEENHLITQQPDYALIFSWHISDYLATKLWNTGYMGKFLIPLPEPKSISRDS
jgi:SAM-dependent methyltransferase